MKRSRSGLVRAATSISLATGLSRILGLVRDQVQSYVFGAGMVTDAYVAAFRIPNLLRDLFAEGALSAAFVPTFTAVREREGDAAAFRLADRILTVLSAVLAALSLAIFVAAPWLLELYTPGFDETKLALATTMTRILAPFLWFVALAALAMGMLNTHGRFFLPSLAPASFNIASILGVLALAPLLASGGFEPGLSLAIGAIAGGFLQFAVQAPALRGIGWRFRPRFAPRDPGVRKVGKLMGPAVFGLAATQVNILVDTSLASRFDAAITWLALAFRLMQLPLGLFGVAIATAHLARVSRSAAHRDLGGMRSQLASAIRMAAVLTIPATAGLIALRRPIVELLFEHGRFTPEDTANTAAAALCYGLGLFAYSVTKIQVPTFYALEQTRWPVICSATAVILKIIASLTLLAWLPRWNVSPFLGLALSTSLAAWINFGMLAAGLRRSLGSIAGLGVARAIGLVSAISVAMGVGVYVLHDLLDRRISPQSVFGDAVLLCAVVGAGASVALAAAAAGGIPEARQLLDRLRRRDQTIG